MCEGGLFFQPFWTEDDDGRLKDENMDAVAERFEMVRENVGYIAVYPAYMVVLGHPRRITVPPIRHQPFWVNEFVPHGSSIEKGLGNLFDVPQSRLPKSQVNLQDQSVEEDADPNQTIDARFDVPLKQKKAPLYRWKQGVHQLLLWLGSSRPSDKCAKNNRAW